MKHLYCVVLLLVLSSLAGAVRAGEDAPKPVEPPAAPKAEPAAPPAEQTKTGVLHKTAAEAGGVLAILHIKTEADARAERQKKKADAAGAAGEKRRMKKADAAAAAEQTFNLTAEGEVATKLSDLAKKDAYVQVSGVITGDTMKVSKVSEAEQPAAPERKKKKNK